MTRTTREKRARFRELHMDGCFVLPNPWDVGSARMLEHLGFEALASTSTGLAWTMGRPDYALSRDEVLAHLAALSEAVDLPVNTDFEAGFARADCARRARCCACHRSATGKKWRADSYGMASPACHRSIRLLPVLMSSAAWRKLALQ
jgi:2-methylisocitrate lyase-like PEP mutase family enzyme